MCCERKEFEIFSFEGQKTWQKAKRREKKQTWQRAKRREKKQLFESKKEAKNKLEKIHLIERRLRTHQEDFTKTL